VQERLAHPLILATVPPAAAVSLRRRGRGRGGGRGGGGGIVGPAAYRGSMTLDIPRLERRFQVVSDFQPAGDQPNAINELEKRVRAGQRHVVLLGATGTGKSATTAWLVERLQRPALVMAPNKTLAAQLAKEFRELMPHNAVEYFVSYYDYYQPEAYIPQTDTYIEKDSSINEEVERLRHSATMSLLTRRDVVVVATVSAIYGLGTPSEYLGRAIRIEVGQEIERDKLLRRLVDTQYARNDMAFQRGTFRVRGDTLEIIPAYEELAVRVEMFGDEVEKLYYLHPLTGEVVREADQLLIFPATHYTAGPERMERALRDIETELEQRLAELERTGKLLEAQRLRMRTTYDIEMMRQVGFCSGIENYSMHIDGRQPGSPPHCLLDYFPDDLLTVIDESHVTVPQIGGMYEGDASRKRVLVEHGFRLPSAQDNRPLRFDEFLERVGQMVFLSATPGPWELEQSGGEVVEQVIRPTGLVDPEVVVKPTKGQIDDLMHEIRTRTDRDERVLVTTLTKKMAEDLTDYLLEHGIRVRYLHSEVDTLRRVELLRELRQGEYDVLVGINLLREGLDLPEVSLVSILDADKEGFLRSGRSLIQTIGRAARNVSGQVHMYADVVTPSMAAAIDETSRRRAKQVAFNDEHGLTPEPLRKKIHDILDDIYREAEDTEGVVAGGAMVGGGGRQVSRGKGPVPETRSRRRSVEAASEGMARAELAQLVQDLNEQMLAAARELQFEVAARIRDEIAELKRELRAMDAAA
jgi:excinuclease ABC subunit B